VIDPWRDKFYPRYSENICDGYNSTKGSFCCREGKQVEDPYPKRAHSICIQFVRIYSGTAWAKSMACVASCLTEVEKTIGDEPDCAKRNNARMNAHWECYLGCRFVPMLKLPAGGREVGIGMLYPDWEDKDTLFGKILFLIMDVYPQREFIDSIF